MHGKRRLKKSMIALLVWLPLAVFAQSGQSYRADSLQAELDKLRVAYEEEKEHNDASLLTKNIELLVASVLLAGISFILYRNMRLKSLLGNALKKDKLLVEEEKRHVEEINNVLQKQNVMAQYELLKASVNPHFLFNSITALSGLILKDQKEALHFAEHFSRLYRQLLTLSSHNLITIEEELDFAIEYFYLQDIRFKDKMLLNVNIHRLNMKKYLPPFSLQLLIENAIKHNTASRESKLVISVFSENDYIVVSNNLQPRDDGKESTGKGQQNIIDRFKLITNRPPRFIKNDGGRYLVYLPIIDYTGKFEKLPDQHIL